MYGNTTSEHNDQEAPEAFGRYPQISQERSPTRAFTGVVRHEIDTAMRAQG